MATAWSKPHDGHGGEGAVGKVRTSSYTLKLNYTFGPKSTRATDEQRILHADPGRCYIVESTVTTPAVPYGDNFQALTRCVCSDIPPQLSDMASSCSLDCVPVCSISTLHHVGGPVGVIAGFIHLAGFG